MISLPKLMVYVKDNPSEPVAEISSKFGVNKQFVYNARHRAGVSVPKKTLAEKDYRIAELENQIEMLKVNPNQEVRYVATPDQISAVRRLEAELLDAKAIIAYLERKLNGTSV